jgi:hypothetical protein
MSPKEEIDANADLLDTAAGLTGIGWTTSLLGYLATAMGNSPTPLVSPQSLLYLGGILFVTTIGLDALSDR